MQQSIRFTFLTGSMLMQTKKEIFHFLYTIVKLLSTFQMKTKMFKLSISLSDRISQIYNIQKNVLAIISK